LPKCGNALQTTVKQVDKNSDGSTTDHCSMKLDQGEALEPGNSKAQVDLVTVYDF
jgi:hypothetical protein